MINGKTVLAVIPARAGSKRCPGKNGRRFRGRILFAWSIEVALKSKYIDKVVFSSDCKEWRDIAFCSVAVDCIERPAHLATDDATSEDVLRDVMLWYRHDWVVLLQPTSPLRTAEDIDGCIETAQMGDGCISTCRGKTNGAVYVATAEWLADHNFSDPGLSKYGMPVERSLDINYVEDFLK